MSFRSRLVLPIILFSLAVLAGCGSSNSAINPVPPPSGGFSNSNLNGTYVFSVSGTDANGAPYAMVGAFTANGSGGNGVGGITAGTIDLNDPAVSAPVADATISSGSYSVGVDGRGKATLSTALPAPFGTVVLDFVLQDSSHGMVTEFDTNGSGSGSLDIQTAGTSAVGSYAFILAGAYISTSSTVAPFATVGNFALGAGGAISAGLQDFNENGFGSPSQTLTGQVVLGPSSTPATTLTTPFASTLGVQTFDVYAIGATHLKFIEMDAAGTLSGDAFSQTSATIPTGSLAFTLSGSYPLATTSSTAGGFMVTDGNGNITSTSTLDANNGGTVSPPGLTFAGTYAAGGTGRSTLSLSSFSGTSYAAYPSSAGLLLLEIDNAGILSGVAYPPQTSTSFNGSAGYGLNFSGINFPNNVEVDDIAEFASATSGATVTGVVDENFAPGGGPNYGLALDGTYTAPDANGRGAIAANAGNSSISTLNGGFGITFYCVDGTTYPFIETDANGQVASGVFFTQSASTSASAAAARPHMFVAPAMVRARSAHWQKK